MKRLSEMLYDHGLQVFFFLLGSGGVIIFWNKLKELFFDFLEYKVSIWIPAAVFLFIFAVKCVVGRIKRRSTGFVITSLSSPPVYKRSSYGKSKAFRVLWRVWSGTDSRIGGYDRLWVDGPFCPEKQCSYELDRKNNKWICVKCGKKFRIPKKIREDTREKVIKIFESEVRSRKKN